MNKFLLTTAALILSSTLAWAEEASTETKAKEEPKQEMQAQKEEVKAACAQDVATTGCKAEGREQMKCIHDYKKKNKDFKFSDACKSAMKGAHEKHKEMKEERKEKREEKRKERKAKKDHKKEKEEEKKESSEETK